jgi:hypothetical protein
MREVKSKCIVFSIHYSQIRVKIPYIMAERRGRIVLDPRYTFNRYGNVVAEYGIHPFTGRVGVWVPFDVDDRATSDGNIGRVVIPNKELLESRLDARTRNASHLTTTPKDKVA